jgi:hypothetical protein
MARIALVYKGESSTDLYTIYYDGNRWSGNNKISSQPGGISPNSDHSPGTCLFRNRLYIVYPSTNSNRALYIAWYDGAQWYGDIKISAMPGNIDPNSNDSPCLIEFQGLMYCIYKSRDSNDIYVAWFDGTYWYGDKKISELPGNISPKTNHGLSATIYNNTLLLVYKGESSDNLFTAWFDGESWQGNTEIKLQDGSIDPKSNYNPSICVYNERVYLIYKAAYNNNLYTAYLDIKKNRWEGDTPISSQPGNINAKSTRSPSSILFNDKMYIIYKGEGTNYLYMAYLDNNIWDGNIRVTIPPGQIGPETTQNPYPIIMPITADKTMSNWLREVDGETLLCDINLPGTHDSAAINYAYIDYYVPLPFPRVLTCQYDSITTQLESGIRLLDIRIRVIKIFNNFIFMTCHDDFQDNYFQSLPSVFEECKRFLSHNKTEVIIMSLKVDNAGGFAVKDYQEALKELLSAYPIYKPSKNPNNEKQEMPKLDDVRGHIYLLNRINSELSFGIPMKFPNSGTKGKWLPDSDYRDFSIYLQDQYDMGFGEYSTLKTQKFECFKAAFKQKGDGMVLINFASAYYKYIFDKFRFDLNIKDFFIDYLGSTIFPERPTKLGWCLFDFVTTSYQLNTGGFINCIQLIVDSNFGYKNYNYYFQVIGNS